MTLKQLIISTAFDNETTLLDRTFSLEKEENNLKS